MEYVVRFFIVKRDENNVENKKFIKLSTQF